MSHDLGGNKKFVEVAGRKCSDSTRKSNLQAAAVAKEEEIGSFPMLKAELERECSKSKRRKRIEKDLKEAVARGRSFSGRENFGEELERRENWIRELGEMEGAEESAKLRKSETRGFLEA